MPLYPRTTLEILCKKFPSVIVGIVFNYFLANSRDVYAIAKAGEYESCMQSSAEDATVMLYGACRGGYLEIICSLLAYTKIGKYEVSMIFTISCDLLRYDIANYFLNLGMINVIEELDLAKRHRFKGTEQMLSAYIKSHH